MLEALADSHPSEILAVALTAFAFDSADLRRQKDSKNRKRQTTTQSLILDDYQYKLMKYLLDDTHSCDRST